MGSDHKNQNQTTYQPRQHFVHFYSFKFQNFGRRDIGSSSSSSNGGHNYQPHFPNPADPTNPDPATLREQWRYATRQYSKWYSHAWGTAILAGLSFLALGWTIKGSNPLPSFGGENHTDQPNQPPKTPPDYAAAVADPQAR